jgi:type I restriction enzyme S subunit
MYFDFVLKNLANEEGKGTAIKNIPPFDILKNFLIPLPPLSEQKKIIKKIKEIFNSLDRIANSIKA